MPDIDKALLEKCARALLEDERKHGGCPAALDMQAHIVLEASGLLAENAALKARVAELEGLVRVEYCKISCRYSHVGFGGDADTPCDPRCPVEQALNGGAGK